MAMPLSMSERNAVSRVCRNAMSDSPRDVEYRSRKRRPPDDDESADLRVPRSSERQP